MIPGGPGRSITARRALPAATSAPRLEGGRRAPRIRSRLRMARACAARSASAGRPRSDSGAAKDLVAPASSPGCRAPGLHAGGRLTPGSGQRCSAGVCRGVVGSAPSARNPMTEGSSPGTREIASVTNLAEKRDEARRPPLMAREVLSQRIHVADGGAAAQQRPRHRLFLGKRDALSRRESSWPRRRRTAARARGRPRAAASASASAVRFPLAPLRQARMAGPRTMGICPGRAAIASGRVTAMPVSRSAVIRRDNAVPRLPSRPAALPRASTMERPRARFRQFGGSTARVRGRDRGPGTAIRASGRMTRHDHPGIGLWKGGAAAYLVHN